VQVQVVEGDPSKPLDHDDNVILKSWEIELPQPQPLGELSIELTYSYDVDGILHVSAEDSLGNRLLDDAVSYGTGVDKRGLAKIAQRVSRTLDSDRIEAPSTAPTSSLDPEARRLVVDVRSKVIPFIDDAEAADLRAAVDSAERGDTSALDALKAATKKYSYLL
jgi:molecular chaperone DnaK